MKFFILIVLFLFSVSYSHNLEHRVEKAGKVVILYFYFPDGSKFSFEDFEVYRKGDKNPFQVGRTDYYGRVLLLPDRDGVWNVKVFSADGHGKVVELEIREHENQDSRDSSAFGKIVMGVSILFGIFGLYTIFLRRRR